MLNRPTAVKGRAILGFLLTILMISTGLKAQTIIGRQKVDQFTYTDWGAQTYALTWLPTDYATNTGAKYPLIIFLHGKGETGNGIGGLWSLIGTALPQIIANGWNPEAVNPVDGQTYKFIVVSPQSSTASQWSYNWNSIQYILPEIISRYRVDPSRIYITGLSAGGQGTWSCLNSGPGAAKKFAAAVAVSGAGVVMDSVPNVGKRDKVKMWQICGTADPLFSLASSSTDAYNSLSPTPNAILTGFPGQGHSSSVWNTAYSPTWRNNAHNKNIYEWMLQYQRTDVSGGTPPPANLLPISNAGADLSITLPTASATLVGSGSDPDGSIVGFAWSQVSGPSTANFSSTATAVTQVSGLVQGTYTFKFTVTDNSGATAYDLVDLVVNPAVATPPPTASNLKIEAENFFAMSGVQTENTSDDGGGLNVGWQDDADWMDYKINLSATGTYNMNFRVASFFNGAQFQLKLGDGQTLGTVVVPNTGSFQTWQTISKQVILPAGPQTIRILTTAANGGWNINWLEIVGATPGLTVNQSPTVNAGADQTITLPVSTVNLSGTASDADGSVASLSWTLVSGPSTPVIASKTALNTQVSGLLGGTYIFRLSATDNLGAIGSDDIVVTVSSPAVPTSIHIEAESYIQMAGVGVENTSDAGGGMNVGWQDNDDWMDYSVNLASAGTYTVNFRVASFFNGPQFQLRKSDGTVLTTITVPNTGSFQNWQTVSATVTLPAGQQILRLYTTAANGGWNINWWEINGASTGTPAPAPLPSALSLHIEAEDYTQMDGVQTETTQDAGFGYNIGWQDNNDWMDYVLTIPTAGTYSLSFRVASFFTGAQFEVRLADGTVVATVTVPNTGSFQNWRTISTSATLPAGQQKLRIVTTNANGGWNINWWEINTPSAARGASAVDENNYIPVKEAASSMQGLSLYPNPATDRIVLFMNDGYVGKMSVQIYDLKGSLVKTVASTKSSEAAMQIAIATNELPRGQYILRVNSGNRTTTKSFIKQ